MNFDIETFVRDFHAYRRRQGHYIKQVAQFIGRSECNLREFLKTPYSERMWFSTVILLADYADLSLDKYRGINGKFKTTRQRAPRLERSRTKSGYPVLRSTFSG